jgi:hypothetical protein
MTREPDQALSVLRDIWTARAQTAAELDATLGHGKACKAMKHVGIGSSAQPVDEDLRTAWRARLAREGKLGDGTVADLLTERDR